MSNRALEIAFRSIAECTYDWETWVGPEGTTRWVNPAVERMTGWTPLECLELEDYPLPLIHPDDRERVSEALRSAERGSAGNDLEFRLLHRDGTTKWAAMSWQSLVMAEGQRLGYRTSVREITARKRLEGQLRQALERARGAERARASFLANISHELRTPLNNVRGHVDQLLEASLDSDVRRHVEVVHDQTNVLIRLVDDLLGLAAHEVPRTPRALQRVRPYTILTQCIEAHRPAVLSAGLALVFSADFPPETEIDSDGDGLGHILRNLLDNATKYTRRGGIEVRAHLEDAPPASDPDVDEPGPFLVIEVSDTGIGIEPQRIDDVRQPLVRGDDSTSRAVSGAGLGLAIVDRICTELRGTLRIESRPGEGTRVTVRLPTHAPAEAPAVPLSDEDFEQLRVLVVDDNDTGRELTQYLLLHLGCSVQTAEHGRDALERTAAQPFDVVLMDLHMPDLDGETTARLMRARTSSHGVSPRIVALTADVFGAAEASLRGFDGRLTKPLDRDELRRVLANMATPASEDAAPRIEQLIDPRRLQELRSVRTADGETFFARFAPRVMQELRDLARTIEQAPPRGGESLHDLAHRIRNSANIIGASDLAREAGQLQELTSTGEEPWAAIASVARQARRVAAALARMF